jgi:uncharacterized BrkB/YihY/UPF0761 family membrane protein
MRIDKKGEIEMGYKNTQKDEEPGRLTKPVLLLWIIPLLLLILVTVITLIGVHFLESRDGDVLSELKGFVVLMLIISVILLIIGSLLVYSSIRYIQLPTWRWIAKGFKGKPDFPWIKKSHKNRTKEQ